MGSVRTSVEWIFGDILASFKFLDFKKNLKIGLSAVSKHYMWLEYIITKCIDMHVWKHHTFFDIEPPSLEEYFA